MDWVINYQDPETQQPGLDRCATSTCWRWDGSPGSASAGRPRGRLAVDDRSHPVDRCGQDLAAGAHVQPDVADAWTAEARPRAERHPPAGEEGGARVVAERGPADRQPPLRRLYAWATSLQDEGLARLLTYFGKRGEVTLLPRLQPDNAGLVTVWNFNGAGYLSVWRSVFERSAPESIATVEQLIAPVSLGKGNTVNQVTDQLLHALTQAYRTAAQGPVEPTTNQSPSGS